MSPLNQRRWSQFKANRRAYWSLWIFLGLTIFTLFAEFVANDQPLMVKFQGEIIYPVLERYDESYFDPLSTFVGTDFHDPYIVELIRTNGDEVLEEGEEPGWILFPPIPYSYDYTDRAAGPYPSPPDENHILGTDGKGYSVAARVIYGFRLSVLFGFTVTIAAAIIGIVAGAAQGYFGGWVDLFFQRVEEVWSAMPLIYVIMIIASVLERSVFILALVFIAFSWTALIGVVRAEFLRARNFEYVRAAKALGVGNWTIMFRHVLPNAMVATVTMLPFMLTASIGLLAGLDFLNFGLEQSYPSLGKLAREAQEHNDKLWLGLTAFFSFAIMLSLLVFIFEGVRDAFDPRKIFT